MDTSLAHITFSTLLYNTMFVLYFSEGIDQNGTIKSMEDYVQTTC